jgi:UDP-glucose 4-epimerase
MKRAAWIVGGGGLLGKAVVREGLKRAELATISTPLPWNDRTRLTEAALAEFRRLLDAAKGGRWSVIWVAGAAVTSSTRTEFDAELTQLRAILAAMTTELGSRAAPGRGAFFYALSAGGVYAGSAHPPFTEQSTVAPISDYGRFKLQAESAVTEFSRASGVPAMLGRIANL